MKNSIKVFLLAALSIVVSANISTQAYEHSPETLKHLRAAKQYIDQNKYKEAKAELEASLKLDPKSPDILNNLGSIYLRLSQNSSNTSIRISNLNNARSYFTQALNIDPDFAAAWNSLADVYYLGGEINKALPYYKKALSLSPKRAFEIETNLANALRDSEQYAEAEESYKKAIELNPLYAPAHNGYSELLYNQNDFSQALSESIEAIRLKPDYATAYYHLGLIETSLDHKENALKAYTLSLRYETNPAYAISTQALIDQLGIADKHISNADLKKYQNSLSQTMAKQPENTASSEKSKSKLALPQADQDLIKKQEWQKAQKELTAELRVKPMDPILLNDLAVVLINQRNFLAAEKLLNKVINTNHAKSAALYYNLAQIYLARHQLEKAQRMLNKAASTNKSNRALEALINNSLAITLKEKGNFIQAKSAYSQAIQKAGNTYPVFHYNLALLLEQMNQKQEAIVEYNHYLQLSPSGSNHDRAQAHLNKLI